MRLTGAPIAYHTPSDTCARLSPKRRSRSNTAPLTPTSEMGSPSSGARHGSIRQALASSHEVFQHSLEFTLLARHPFGRHLLERLVHHFLGEMHHALQPRLELRQRLHVLLNQFARIQTCTGESVNFQSGPLKPTSWSIIQSNEPHGQRMRLGGARQLAR